MPKLPRLSGAAIVRALERLGFEKVRQSGSHVIMRRGPKGCVVPMHSEVRSARLRVYCAKPTCRQSNLLLHYKTAKLPILLLLIQTAAAKISATQHVKRIA